MTINNIDVEATIDRINAQIAKEENLSTALKSSLEELSLTGPDNACQI
jgi:hypothetical protein